jgi:hypothetical protein
MYAFLSKLLLTKKISFDQGKIVLFNEPYAIIAMESLKAMTDDAIKEGRKSISDLYFYGWVFGFVGVEKAMNMFKLKKFEERYKLSMDIASLIGFGDYKTLEYKKAEFAKFLAIKNPFALEYYKSDKLVDHYLRGVNAGGGTVGHEILMQCVELECGAQTGENCRFINATRDILEKTVDKKLIDTQLDMDYLESKQIEIMKKYAQDPLLYGLK